MECKKPNLVVCLMYNMFTIHNTHTCMPYRTLHMREIFFPLNRFWKCYHMSIAHWQIKSLLLKNQNFQVIYCTWICRTAALSVGTLGSANTCLRSLYVLGLEWSRDSANALSDVVHRRPLSFRAMAPRSWDMKNSTCSLERKSAMVVRSSRSCFFCLVAADSCRAGASPFATCLLFSLYTCKICIKTFLLQRHWPCTKIILLR